VDGTQTARMPPARAATMVAQRPRRVGTSGFTTALAPEAIVTRWVDAFNERDLEGMLARFHPEVRFHPLRLVGLDGSYRGHDGVRRWFTQLRDEHVFVLSEVQGLGNDQVLAVGALALAEGPEIAPLCALHRIRDGLIMAAHHYLTDPDMLDRLGLVP
jgi:SnoaL-like domain